MNSRYELNDCFQLFSSIDRPSYPRAKIDLYVDFVELFVLFSNIDGVSKGDINDRFFGTEDYPNPESRDKDESFINSIIDQFESRLKSHGDHYPFTISYNTGVNITKIDCPNWKAFSYITLLMSSNLSIFKSFGSTLTKEFESYSAIALKHYLGDTSRVLETGKNTNLKGNAKNKIKIISKQLNLKINKKNFEEIDPKNNQELGLDILAWTPFIDKNSNFLIFLGQCACGSDWETKHSDTRKYKKYLNFEFHPINLMFIPYSHVLASKKRFVRNDIFDSNYIYFERKRILDFIKYYNQLKSLKSYNIANELFYTNTFN